MENLFRSLNIILSRILVNDNSANSDLSLELIEIIYLLYLFIIYKLFIKKQGFDFQIKILVLNEKKKKKKKKKEKQRREERRAVLDF